MGVQENLQAVKDGYQAFSRGDIPGLLALLTVHRLVNSLQGDVLSDSEVLHVFTVNTGLIAAMDLGGEADPTAGPSAAVNSSGCSKARRTATTPPLSTCP
jgi:hypothetical protein